MDSSSQENSDIDVEGTIEKGSSSQVLLNWIKENMGDNDTHGVEWHQIRLNLKYVYPLFVFFFAVVSVFGVIGNSLLLIQIIKMRLYFDPTHFFMGSLAISDIIKALMVLPITLSNLLLRNWMLGSFLCYFLPMLQQFPIHASMLTFLVIAVDRYRLILYPMKPRVPVGLCVIAAWVISVCLVLPIAVFFKYIDVGELLPEYEGLGICYISISKNYEEYIRAIFVTMYAMPLAVIAFLYIKVSAEIKTLIATEDCLNFRAVEVDCRNSTDHSYHHSRIASWSVAASGCVEQRGEPEGASGSMSHDPSSISEERRGTTTIVPPTEIEEEVDYLTEKRTQKYLISMVTLFGLCWCPMNIMVLVVPFIVPEETKEKETFMDITYIALTWFGFLSTCTNPVLFASWRMSDRVIDRLRGYFKFTNRRRTPVPPPCVSVPKEQYEATSLKDLVVDSPIKLSS